MYFLAFNRHDEARDVRCHCITCKKQAQETGAAAVMTSVYTKAIDVQLAELAVGFHTRIFCFEMRLSRGRAFSVKRMLYYGRCLRLLKVEYRSNNTQ